MEPEPGTQWPIAPRAIKNSAAAENRPNTTASSSCRVCWKAFSCQNLLSCDTAFKIQGKLCSQDPSKEHEFLGTPALGRDPGTQQPWPGAPGGVWEVRGWRGSNWGPWAPSTYTKQTSKVQNFIFAAFFPYRPQKTESLKSLSNYKGLLQPKSKSRPAFQGYLIRQKQYRHNINKPFLPIAKVFCNNKLLSHIILQKIIKTSRIPWTDWIEGHKNKNISIWVCLEIPWVSFLEFDSLIQEYSQSHILLSTLYFHNFYRHEEAFSTPHIPFHQIQHKILLETVNSIGLLSFIV